jgi:hypothetical protein
MADLRSLTLAVSRAHACVYGAAQGAVWRVRAAWYALMMLRWRHNPASAKISVDTRIRLQHSVIVGKDNFLFHRDCDAIEQLTGALTYTPRHLEQWVSTVADRRIWCDSKNIVSRFLIIPEKHVVYQDKLPRTIRISKRRAAAQIISAAGPAFDNYILYPDESLRKARARKETFFLTDTHWTHFGAFIAYQELVRSISCDRPIEMVDEDELAWTEQAYIGDLGVRFDPERSETASMSQFITPLPYRLAYQNRKFGRGAVHIYESNRKDLPHCVLFRDSFANFLIPYLMKGFSRLVAVSSLSCHYDLLEVERPDVTILAVVERFLASYGMGGEIEMPQDQNGLSFEQCCDTDLNTVVSSR